MIKSPYETTVGKSYRIDEVTEKIMMYVNTQHWASSIIEIPWDKQIDIKMVSDDWKAVPWFSQVVEMQNPFTPERMEYFVDVRQMASTDRNGQIKFKSSNEKMFTTVRALLTAGWMQGRVNLFTQAIDWPMRIYSQWMVRALARTYPIQPATNVRITVLAALFFRSQFEKDEMSERDAQMVAQQIARATRVPDNIAQDIVKSVGVWIKDVQHFCEVLAQHSENIAMDDIVPAKIFTVLGGTWYGAGAAEHVAVAVEYPPTFYAMLLTALADNSYRKTMIGEIAKDNMRDQGVRQLQLAMKPLVIL